MSKKNPASEYEKMLKFYEEQYEAPANLVKTAKSMGLDSYLEALLCVPARYEDLSDIAQNINEAHRQQEIQLGTDPEKTPKAQLIQCTLGKISEIKAITYQNKEVDYPFARNVAQLRISAYDNDGQKFIIGHFGSPFIWKDIYDQGELELFIRGNAKRFGRYIWLSNAEVIPENMVGKIRPVYLGIPGKVSGARVQELVDWAKQPKERLLACMKLATKRISIECGSLADAELMKLAYPAISPKDMELMPKSLAYLIAQLHGPKELRTAELAHESVRKLCALAIKYQSQVANTRAPCPEASLARLIDDKQSQASLGEIAESVIKHIEATKGYPLTENQKEVGVNILEDMFGQRPLNGLLNGEVGSGKTVAYAIPSIVAHKLGAKVMIQAPTELLADQIARELALMSDDSVSVIRVPTGQEKLENHDAILVGTIGLSSVAKRSKYWPDLFICDEQHKLHTAAREAMVAKHTHTLDISATPIPRSVALSLSDGMKCYELNEQPVKKEIQTMLVDKEYRKDIVAQIDQTIKAGARVAIVFARISPTEQEVDVNGLYTEFDENGKKIKPPVAKSSALEGFTAFSKSYPGKVGLLHGRLKDHEKLEALNRFRAGETPILITTTIIETGIDVPDVKMIVVRDAQCMGLSQLHQLRGRIARNGGKGSCTLMVENINELSEDTKSRLNFFTQNDSGYDLALADLIMRGAGEILGDKGSGQTKTLFKGNRYSVRELLDVGADEEFVLQQQAEHSEEAYAGHRQSSLF